MANLKVTEIYFEHYQEGFNKAPTFVLENGMIKRPRLKTTYGVTKVLWLTDEEFEYEKEVIEAQKENKKWYQKIF